MLLYGTLSAVSNASSLFAERVSCQRQVGFTASTLRNWERKYYANHNNWDMYSSCLFSISFSRVSNDLRGLEPRFWPVHALPVFCSSSVKPAPVPELRIKPLSSSVIQLTIRAPMNKRLRYSIMLNATNLKHTVCFDKDNDSEFKSMSFVSKTFV